MTARNLEVRVKRLEQKLSINVIPPFTVEIGQSVDEAWEEYLQKYPFMRNHNEEIYYIDFNIPFNHDPDVDSWEKAGFDVSRVRASKM